MSTAALQQRLPVMERQVLQLHRLGPRTMLELLVEVGSQNHCLTDVQDRLANYAGLSPEAVRLAGADRMVPRRLLLAPV